MQMSVSLLGNHGILRAIMFRIITFIIKRWAVSLSGWLLFAEGPRVQFRGT
jgi:hypothetical protein